MKSHQGHEDHSSLEQQYNALVAQQVAAAPPVQTYVAYASDGEDQIHVKGCYNPSVEETVWMHMRECQRVHAPLLAAPTSTLRGIAMEAWNSLKYIELHKEIDWLYTKLFGVAAKIELVLEQPVASDRVKAVLKLSGLEELMIQTMAAGDRLEAFAGDVVVLTEADLR